ncbi:MAG TPA: hypothetical protein VFQ35_15370 [Polyangiaceae bacterium]|nr:hypothetical protein [Polyangiaceae bacterium]
MNGDIETSRVKFSTKVALAIGFALLVAVGALWLRDEPERPSLRSVDDLLIGGAPATSRRLRVGGTVVAGSFKRGAGGCGLELRLRGSERRDGARTPAHCGCPIC